MPSRRSLFGACSAALCLSAISGGPASHAQVALVPVNAPAPAYLPGQVVVRYRPGASPVAAKPDQAASRNAAVRPDVLRRLGAQAIDSVPALNLQLLRLPVGADVFQAIAALKQDPSVLYAEPNYRVEAADTVPNDNRFGSLWGMRNTGSGGGVSGADVKAVKAWDLFTGSKNVVIAVLDTGTDYNHPDLTANIWTNPAEVAGNGKDDDGDGVIDDVHGARFDSSSTPATEGDPIDFGSHGTHVAGTIGAAGNNGVGVAGVNWNVTLLPIRFLNPTGSTFDAAKAVNYVHTLKTLWQTSGGAKGADVVAMNHSWGGGGRSQALYDAFKASAPRGIVHLCAAGNNSSNNDALPFYPANYGTDAVGVLTNLVSVAATNNRDALAGFSCFGAATVHLGAPGEGILSTVPGNGYSFFNGTSMATPHVTGAVGLLIGYQQSIGLPLSATEVIDRLLNTGDPTAAMLPATITGRRLNVHNLLTNTRPTLPPGGTTVSTSAQIDRPVYAPSKKVIISAKAVKEDGTAASGVPVQVTVTAPSGAQWSGVSSTDAAGNAVFYYMIPRSNAAGTYNVSTVFAAGAYKVVPARVDATFQVFINIP